METAQRLPSTDLLAACAAYRRVSAAIAELSRPGGEKLDLAGLARRVGTKPLTLQRGFSAWAGVSPILVACALLLLATAGCRSRLPVDRAPQPMSTAPGEALAPAPTATGDLRRVEYFQISDG